MVLSHVEVPLLRTLLGHRSHCENSISQRIQTVEGSNQDVVGLSKEPCVSAASGSPGFVNLKKKESMSKGAL